MIFLELVPRDLHELGQEAQQMLQTFPELTGINVPDVLRVPIRSDKAASYLADKGIQAIPHIRAIDRSLADSVRLAQTLWQSGVKEILVVKGDPPIQPSVATYDIASADLIQAVKTALPKMTVYGALDPYRQSVSQELAYIKLKQDHGADGFFSQPFFDPRFAELFLEHLPDTPIFLGISPVLSEKSLNYWKVRNQAVFPKGFGLDLSSNAQVARALLATAKKANQHAYLMPITCSVPDYLALIFDIKFNQ